MYLFREGRILFITPPPTISRWRCVDVRKASIGFGLVNALRFRRNRTQSKSPKFGQIRKRILDLVLYIPNVTFTSDIFSPKNSSIKLHYSCAEYFTDVMSMNHLVSRLLSLLFGKHVVRWMCSINVADREPFFLLMWHHNVC